MARERMSSVTLTTPRLVLRNAHPDDADDVYHQISDWDVVKNLQMPPWPCTRDHAVEFASNASRYLIEYRGQLIGIISIEDHDNQDTLGYWIGKAFWGKGLMSEAVNELVEEHFDNPQAAPLFSGYAEYNVASWRIQEKTGFSKIGEELTHFVARDVKVKMIKTQLTREAFEKAMR